MLSERRLTLHMGRLSQVSSMLLLYRCGLGMHAVRSSVTVHRLRAPSEDGSSHASLCSSSRAVAGLVNEL